MKLLNSLFILFLCANLSPAMASVYTMEGFEVVVTETLPESMNLSMTLDEITAAKHVSRVAETKKKIYGFILKNLNPVISKQVLGKKSGLFDLAAEIPLNALIDDIMDLQKNSSSDLSPADFMIAIFPKVPRSETQDNLIRYESLYSSTKASVIDNPRKGFLPEFKHNRRINQRVEDSLFYTFKRNYVELASNLPFFAGALLNIHIQGPASWGRLQIMAGLPTGLAQDFIQNVPEADFSHFKSPNIPTFKSIEYNDFPGGILDLTIRPGTENPAMLKIKFGNLGRLEDRSWEVINSPISFSDQWGTKSIGFVGMGEHFNVPHLFGQPKTLAGNKEGLNNYINNRYSLKMNVHEVEIDLMKVEITNMRITVDLPYKDTPAGGKWWVPMLPLRFLTLEQPAASEQFKTKGNEFLEPFREKIERVMVLRPEELLKNPALRKNLLEMFINFLNSKSSKGAIK